MELKPKQVKDIVEAMQRVRDVADDIRAATQQKGVDRKTRCENVGSLLLVNECAAVEVLAIMGISMPRHHHDEVTA